MLVWVGKEVQAVSRRVRRPNPADWVRQNRGNAMKRRNGKKVYVILDHVYTPFTPSRYGIEARIVGEQDKRVILSWRDAKTMVRAR